MKVLILGIDGMLGWPTALHLSAAGHEVMGLDNGNRRQWVDDVGSASLVPIPPLRIRAAVWRNLTGRAIGVVDVDVRDYAALSAVVAESRPDTVIHYAEQPSAPFSMRDRLSAHTTAANNVLGTINVLFAMRKHVPHSHLIKLGSMGEYGVPDVPIPEAGPHEFPRQPGSYYHSTKVADSVNIEFACRVWGLRATDINQGVVYGVGTDQTRKDPSLATRFDYDETFGTVINRYCVQAIAGLPLTIYGRGGQTRGFLNIADVMRCVELLAEHPPEAHELRTVNQFVEQWSVRELAMAVKRAGEQLGWRVEVESVPNPRIEKEEHFYQPVHEALTALGLEPTPLSEKVLIDMLQYLEPYRGRIIRDVIAPRTLWNQQEGR